MSPKKGPEEWKISSDQPETRVRYEDLPERLERLDNVFEEFPERASYLEFAEETFFEYHRKGRLTEEDPLIFYNKWSDDEYSGRIIFEQEEDMIAQVVFGDSHDETVPVNVGGGIYRNIQLLMPTHDAYNEKLEELLE